MKAANEYIHQRQRWPDLVWSDHALAPLLAATRHKQGKLLGRMKSLGFDLREEANLEALTADVVKSSAIEGELLNPEEVRSSLARRLGMDAGGLVQVSRNVEGIVEVMHNATQECFEPLTKERLFDWHAALFPTGRSGMHRITVGAWRLPESDPMRVVSGPIGRERTHFVAPNADRLDAEMEKFLAWFNGQISIDPVLKAGLAHFWFVTIHPFGDGNGRIARAIADMALARADNSPQRFYSMSSRIEAEKKDYYQQLERRQRGDLDITEWLIWFLGCLDRAIDSAEETLGRVLYKAKLWQRINERGVNERQRTVINRLLSDFEGKLTSSKYAKLAKCSPDTALRDIHELLERGVLVQNEAGGRSTSYRLVELEAIAD